MLEELRKEYLFLINERLPSEIDYPVKNNHCFARIILDYISGCKWDTKLTKPGYKQLTEAQLFLAVTRMKRWITNRNTLIADNIQSLKYRQ